MESAERGTCLPYLLLPVQNFPKSTRPPRLPVTLDTHLRLQLSHACAVLMRWSGGTLGLVIARLLPQIVLAGVGRRIAALLPRASDAGRQVCPWMNQHTNPRHRLAALVLSKMG